MIDWLVINHFKWGDNIVEAVILITLNIFYWYIQQGEAVNIILITLNIFYWYIQQTEQQQMYNIQKQANLLFKLCFLIIWNMKTAWTLL
jgi:hypothetical protein